MGATQMTQKSLKRFRFGSSSKLHSDKKAKHSDRFRTTSQSISLRNRPIHCHTGSVSSSNGSYSSHSAMTTTTMDSDIVLNDFDYRKLSTLTGLPESKINDLHREFLILSDNGRLTFARFKVMLESSMTSQNLIKTERLARQAFQLFDKDGNNYLDFAEFIAAYIIMEKNELIIDEASFNPSFSATTFQTPHRNVINEKAMFIQQKPILSPALLISNNLSQSIFRTQHLFQ